MVLTIRQWQPEGSRRLRSLLRAFVIHSGRLLMLFGVILNHQDICYISIDESIRTYNSCLLIDHRHLSGPDEMLPVRCRTCCET